MKSLEEFEEAFRGVTFQKGLDDVEETIASAECEVRHRILAGGGTSIAPFAYNS